MKETQSNLNMISDRELCNILSILFLFVITQHKTPAQRIAAVVTAISSGKINFQMLTFLLDKSGESIDDGIIIVYKYRAFYVNCNLDLHYFLLRSVIEFITEF